MKNVVDNDLLNCSAIYTERKCCSSCCLHWIQLYMMFTFQQIMVRISHMKCKFSETPVACHVSCILILSIELQHTIINVHTLFRRLRDCLWEFDWIIGVGCWERWLFWSAICILFSMKSLPSKESILLLLLVVFENYRALG